MFVLRKFKLSDVEKCLKIYNYYIKHSLGNFEEKPLTTMEFTILSKKILLEKLPFIICTKNSKLVGFTFLNKFRNKSGYRFSYENSIYVDNHFLGQGMGNKLLKELINVSSKIKEIKTIIAVIGSHNSEASIKTHKKNGFNIIGKLKKVGFKKNQWLDSIYMQRILNEKN